MSEKLTDAARIDWLISRIREPDLDANIGYWIGGDGRTRMDFAGSTTIYDGATLREAIDAAIDAERESVHSEGRS